MYRECPRLPSPLLLALSSTCILAVPFHTGFEPAPVAITCALLVTTAYTAWAIEATNREVASRAKRMEANIATRLNELAVETSFSRVYFESRLNQEIKRSTRYDTPLSVIYAELKLPIDASAEAAVILAGATLLRTEDTFAPIGASEYAFFLPQTGTGGARIVIDRLAGALSEYEPDFGLVQLLPGIDIDAEWLIDAARTNARRTAASRQWNESLAVH